ncbi:hypothetical protein AOC36_10470 [Erysipelothrix larvae]|uniref:N-acetyltransferase domain-containing protein n=1 Tax=Erysipelothrix larvae TaxID=1514105 RepID=A0A120JTZ1_9FIRM|nr:GNAT family N-acetyltransferase [Erysipelothrix larvae]AMC94380.1 hypothetical protein AOC36_10470 [Erysipelothrix larvae]
MEILKLENDQLEKTRIFLNTLLKKHQDTLSRPGFTQVVEFGYSFNHEGRMLGAILCKQTDEVIHIELLGVDERDRGKHIGSRLMESVVSYAKTHGCTRITLTTQDYQAKGFYESCGFEVFGFLEDTPIQGTTKYYMTKKCDL